LAPRSIFSGEELSAKVPKASDGARQYAIPRLLTAGVTGAGAAIACNYMPPAFIQPLRLLLDFYPSSLAALVLLADDRESALVRFRYPLAIATGYGLIAFSGSGMKGVLFLTLFQLAWFVGSARPKLRGAVIGAASMLATAFIVFLPAFQSAKDTYQRTKSQAATFDTLVRGISGDEDPRLARNSRKPPVERTWEYLGIRLCLATQAHRYYRRYAEVPHGYESLIVSAKAALPRVIYPDKISTSGYYDMLARLSGIGNLNDRTSSFKPSFFDESIIIWGKRGFIIGGVLFGLYLAGLEHIIRLITGGGAPQACMRFAWAIMGQLPYFGVMLGGSPYVIIFGILVVAPFYKHLWRHVEQRSTLHHGPTATGRA
jgi:hypothetical protein